MANSGLAHSFSAFERALASSRYSSRSVAFAPLVCRARICCSPAAAPRLSSGRPLFPPISPPGRGRSAAGAHCEPPSSSGRAGEGQAGVLVELVSASSTSTSTPPQPPGSQKEAVQSPLRLLKGGSSLQFRSGALMAKRKLYAVKRGRSPGLYDTWDEAKAQVKGFSGAMFKSFKGRNVEQEARSYMSGSGETAPPDRTPAHELISAGEKDVTPDLQAEADSTRKSVLEPPAPDCTPVVATEDDSVHEEPTVVEGAGGVKVHVLQFDGGSRGNPGVSGAGYVITDPEGKLVCRQSIYLGDNLTNNQAEYEALIEGLAHAHREGIRRLDVQGDSELVVRQMNGLYQVKDERLKELHARATRARQEFDHVELEHIFREENTEADALANQAMDTRTSSPGLSVLQEKGGDLA